MTCVLLYADDPGAANYLFPVRDGLVAEGLDARLIVAPSLVGYMADRGVVAEKRAADATPKGLLTECVTLVVGTSEEASCFGHRLIETARKAEIPSIGVVDMEVNAANRFRGGTNDSLQFVPDLLAVPDRYTFDAYVALGLEPGRIAICGHPYYDVVRARRKALEEEDRETLRRRLFPQAPPGRPVWLFLAEGVDQLDPLVSFRSDDYTLAGRGDSDFRACIVLEELLDVAMCLEPRPWVVLRLHPKNDLCDFSPALAEIGMISQGGDPLPMLWAADRVVGMTTMLLLEAFLLGCSHLSVLPKPGERDWLITLKAGLTPVATTREALHQLLSAAALPGLADNEEILPRGAVASLVTIVRHYCFLGKS